MAICIDASVLIAFVVPEIHSRSVRRLFRDWSEGELVAPTLIRYECAASARKQVVRRQLTKSEAMTALQKMLIVRLRLFGHDELHLRALELADRLGLPTTYDAHYLALAQELDCEFWTGDERLYNSVTGQFPLVRFVGAAA